MGAFGVRLRELREAAGLSKNELARRAGVDATYLGRLERGAYAPPRINTIRQLGAALNLSSADISNLFSLAGRVVTEGAAVRALTDPVITTTEQNLERILAANAERATIYAREEIAQVGVKVGHIAAGTDSLLETTQVIERDIAQVDVKVDHLATATVAVLRTAREIERYLQDLVPPLRGLLHAPGTIVQHANEFSTRNRRERTGRLALEASVKTLSAAVSDSRGISPAEIADSLRGIADELGGRAGDQDAEVGLPNFCIIVADGSDEFFNRIALGASHELRSQMRCNISMHNTNEQFINEWGVIYQERARHVDGFIIVPSIRPDGASAIEHPNSMHALLADTPVVFVDRPAPQGLVRPVAGGSIPFPEVLIDNIGEAKRALGHLIDDHKYKRIAALSFSAAVRTDRTQGYTAAMAEARLMRYAQIIDVTPDLSLQLDTAYGERAYGDVIVDRARAKTREMLAQGRQTWPQAIFTTNNRVSEGVLKAFYEEGVPLGTPAGIAFVSFDLPNYWRDILDLTAIVQNPEEMGKQAAGLLADWIRHGRPPESIRDVPTEWHLGTSCGCRRKDASGKRATG